MNAMEAMALQFACYRFTPDSNNSRAQQRRRRSNSQYSAAFIPTQTASTSQHPYPLQDYVFKITGSTHSSRNSYCPARTSRLRTLSQMIYAHNIETFSLLLSSGVTGICNTNNNANIDLEAFQAGWNRQDLSFHQHTRRHFIDLHQEQLSPQIIKKKPPPAKHQRIILSTAPLPKPSFNDQNSNFYQIIQTRQTIRTYSSNPVTAKALGNLLWYSMHTREEILIDPSLPRSYEGLLRPVASAGGLHSIELYLCIHQCIGISPGFYHYDTFNHTLGKVSDLNTPCQNMLEMAVNTTCRAPQAASVSPGQGQKPDILIVMAARYERNASLHFETGLAYALILKDAGSIYQQLYLVATALGLAPCGLSFGSSELLEQISGISSKFECSVGEFMIGNP